MLARNAWASPRATWGRAQPSTPVPSTDRSTSLTAMSPLAAAGSPATSSTTVTLCPRARRSEAAMLLYCVSAAVWRLS